MASYCCSQACFLALQANKPPKVFDYVSARSVLNYSNVLRREWNHFWGSTNILLPTTRVTVNTTQRNNLGATASYIGECEAALRHAWMYLEMTKRSVESSIPYIVLGALYAYLLCLSWTSETLRLMFASKYWRPELPGIARMFSSDLTVASAWLHLLAVDLFAARQVFQDGLKDGIETRHSIILCLLFCPIGIMSHMVTKAIAHLWRGFNQKREAAASIATICGE